MDTALDFKRLMIAKEYDSLFNVYGRQMGLVSSFRQWTITLLTGYMTFLLAYRPTVTLDGMFVPAFLLILLFMVLEIGERGVMRALLAELRHLETLFMVLDDEELTKQVKAYEFRDMRDARVAFSERLEWFVRGALTIQVLAWYPALTLITFFAIRFVHSGA